MPGLVKVGYSLKDPDLRASELDGTSSPHPHVVGYEILIEDPRDIEQQVHKKLAEYNEGKEWFRCSLDKAASVVKSIAGEEAIILESSSKINTQGSPRDKSQELADKWDQYINKPNVVQEMARTFYNLLMKEVKDCLAKGTYSNEKFVLETMKAVQDVTKKFLGGSITYHGYDNTIRATRLPVSDSKRQSILYEARVKAIKEATNKEKIVQGEIFRSKINELEEL